MISQNDGTQWLSMDNTDFVSCISPLPPCFVSDDSEVETVVDSDSEESDVKFADNSISLRDQFFNALQDVFKKQDPTDQLFDIVFMVKNKEIYAHMLILRLCGATKLIKYIEENGTGDTVKKIDMNFVDGNQLTFDDLYIFTKSLYFNNVENDLTPSNVMLLSNLEIKHATLVQLLNQRIFKADAKTLFDKVFDWAKKNACVQKDDSKGTVYREVLGEALSLIPFNEMSQIQIFEVYDTGILTSTEILFYLRPIVTANDKTVTLLPSKIGFVENNSESTQKVASTTKIESIELLNRVTTSSETKNERSLKNEHKPLEKTNKFETLKPCAIPPFINKEMNGFNKRPPISAQPSFENGNEPVDIAKLIEQAEDIKYDLEKLSTVEKSIEEPEQYALLIKASREGRSGLEQILTKIDEAPVTPETVQEYRNRVVELAQFLLNLEDQLSHKLKKSADIHDKYKNAFEKTDDAKEVAEKVLHEINPPTTSLHHVQKTTKTILKDAEELGKTQISLPLAADLQTKCKELQAISENVNKKKLDFDMSESSGKRKPFNEDFSPPIGRNQRVSYEGPSSLLRSLNEDKW
uniref:BTB domain-containing protein n=1 Tax=Panagrolaimus davidi TaxID=227884 RepID=A0A914Q5D0_9BILA